MLDAVRRHVRPLARIGCAAVGTMYVFVGGVALIALTGHLIEYADTSRIPQLLEERVPGGVAIVWALAAGAAAYAAWRVLQALSDPYGVGTDPLASLKRVAIGASGAAYGFVAWSAMRVVLSAPEAARDASEQRQQHLVARVLNWPAGAWLVALAGLAVAVVGLVQFWYVIRQSYAHDIRITPRTRSAERVIATLASYGYSARGVLLCVLGYFLLRSAVSQNPSVVGDTDTAFDFIGGGVLGNTAFAIVAIGTIAYGLFMYANAWLYRFDSEPGRLRNGRPTDT
jgi:hypothetical protein